MGMLKPRATYIYEKSNGVTYARESGSSDRIEIGRDYERTEFDKQLGDELLWKDIFRESKKNAALHDALERAKVIYYIGKDDGV